MSAPVREPARYLGFDLLIGETDVELRMRGRKVTTTTSVRAARLFVRGWRRAEREEKAV